MTDYEMYELGDWPLESGEVLADARLAYKTYGNLAPSHDNVVLFPTAYGQRHTDCEPFFQEGLALDPQRWFIVVPNMFGNGLSSSPSNTRPPHDRGRFPRMTIDDMVRAQHRLLTEHLGIERLALVTGTSMGALQTFHWGAHHPEMVERILPTCGAARCSVHNYVFLEGVKAALTCDPAFKDGDYEERPERGLRAMGRVWAGWALSQAFYRERRYLELGFADLEDYLVRAWEEPRLDRDANDMLSMIWTWQHADIAASPRFNGDFAKALAAIEAEAIVMPGSTDLYFPPEDNAYEVARMPHAELRPIPSIFGHGAGGRSGRSPEDEAFVDAALKELLARPGRLR
ncbi:MAG: alpha/beta fold hydrolase [Dehalococcoidia bacterium]|nr:alpha/beta fold hydrolase [Dehalococcoidia bacterium]